MGDINIVILAGENHDQFGLQTRLLLEQILRTTSRHEQLESAIRRVQSQRTTTGRSQRREALASKKSIARSLTLPSKFTPSASQIQALSQGISQSTLQSFLLASAHLQVGKRLSGLPGVLCIAKSSTPKLPRLIKPAAVSEDATVLEALAAVAIVEDNPQDKGEGRHRKSQKTSSRQSDFASTYLKVLQSKGVSHEQHALPAVPHVHESSPREAEQPSAFNVGESPAAPSASITVNGEPAKRRSCTELLEQVGWAMRWFASSSACLQCFGGDIPSSQRPLSLLPPPKLIKQQPSERQNMVTGESSQRSGTASRAALQDKPDSSTPTSMRPVHLSASTMPNQPAQSCAGRRVIPGTMTTSRGLSPKKGSQLKRTISSPIPGSFQHSASGTGAIKAPGSKEPDTSRATMWPSIRDAPQPAAAPHNKDDRTRRTLLEMSALAR